MKMQSTLKNMICRLLVVAVMMLPFQSGHASMIGTDQVNTVTSAQLDRNTVVNFLNRADTANELQALGLDAQTAKDRVAAMTDDEVRSLAGKIAAAPAGADVGSVVLVLVIIWAIWYFAFRR
jgi:hypothetical protein